MIVTVVEMVVEVVVVVVVVNGDSGVVEVGTRERILAVWSTK